MKPVDELRRQLAALRVPRERPLMLHVGMRKVGGRAELLLDALRSHVTPEGTLLMVLGADEEEPFDAQTSEVDLEDMGVFAETFRLHPETRVSDHAAARFGAMGKLADELLRDPPLDDYYGRGSVLEHLVAAGGVVLRLGADADTVTLTHHAEYLAELESKRRVRRRYVRADSGEQWIESLDDSDGIAQWSEGDYFPQIWLDYRSGPEVVSGTVGKASAEWFHAGAFVAFAKSWMERNLS